MNKSPSLQVDNCQVCGKQDYITEASYRKHTGIAIIAQTE
jgi:hypothetical protein